MKKTYNNPQIMIETFFAEDILTESTGIGLQNDDILDYNDVFNS